MYSIVWGIVCVALAVFFLLGIIVGIRDGDSETVAFSILSLVVSVVLSIAMLTPFDTEEVHNEVVVIEYVSLDSFKSDEGSEYNLEGHDLQPEDIVKIEWNYDEDGNKLVKKVIVLEEE